MGGIGGPELLLVLLVVLIVFGPRRIPEIARGLGRGMRELQRLSTEFQRELNIADALEGRSEKKGGKASGGGTHPETHADATPVRDPENPPEPAAEAAPEDAAPEAPDRPDGRDPA